MVPQIGQFTTYLIDLDGVIYRGEELLAGAKEFINWLNTHQKKYLFLTNNSFASEAQVVEKLARLGIVTDRSHVLAAAQAAVNHIAHHFPGAYVYVVGEQPLVDLVRTNGLQVVNTHSEKDQLANAASTKADVVLVGLDRSFDYKKLTEAILAVRAGAGFIAINRDTLLPVASGFIAGCGTMVAAIEAGSGVSPEVVGKPQPMLLQEAMSLLGSQPEETVMIGDGLDTDIQAGKAAGTYTLLVLSGKDSRESLQQASIRPDYVYEDLAALIKEIGMSSKTC
jgi:HAD superfamily hydrolase (TIGR01457 family)